MNVIKSAITNSKLTFDYREPAVRRGPVNPAKPRITPNGSSKMESGKGEEIVTTMVVTRERIFGYLWTIKQCYEPGKRGLLLM